MEIPKGYKQTQVGVIPDDWEVQSIQNVAETSSGGTPSRTNPEFFKGNIKWFTTSELNDCHLFDSLEHISEPALNNSSAKLFAKGTLLMAMYGATIGKLGILQNDATTNQACCAIKCKGCNTDFLFYLLLHNRAAIVEKGCGAGQPNISQNIVNQLTFAFPPIDEQKAIAQHLSEMDELIAGLDEQIAKKRQIKEGAMQQLLTGKTRLPGFSSPWREVVVGDIGYTYSGITGKSKGDFGRGNASYITFLNVLNNPVIDTTIFERVNIAPTEGQNAAHRGDLFFNTSSETPEEVGICAVLNDEIENLYLNSFCFGYRLIDESVLGHYLAYFWRSKKGRNIMTSLAQGATRYNLSKAYFNLVVLTIPQTLEEQIAIVEVIDTMDDEIRQLEAERDKYTLIKQGMMQELLTGKTRLV